MSCMRLTKQKLERFYIKNKKSSAEIAKYFNCSEHKVNYWLEKHNISKRSISEAIYARHNPRGDPFKIYKPLKIEDAKLWGLGLGLYWGEGNKLNKYGIRLGNTDPNLIKRFIEFLISFYGINPVKTRFGLQIFSDISPIKALNFWLRHLGVSKSQFQKIIVTKSRGLGTYNKKMRHGVLTVQYYNKKLRDIIINDLKYFNFGDF